MTHAIRGSLSFVTLAACLVAVTAASQSSNAPSGRTTTASSTPPSELIDHVLRDIDIKSGVSLALDNGYGIGIDSWDGTKTDIRKQIIGRQIDLNGDGQREWLVLVASHVWCFEGGRDCRLLVYSGVKDGYRRISADYSFRTGPTISATQLGEIQAGPDRTNNWLDVSWHSPARGTTVVLKYDGQQYRPE